MSDTWVTVVGNTTADPELRFSKEGGRPFTFFTVAQNKSTFDRHREQWVQTGTNFIKSVAFGSMALNIHESLKKGDPVVVHGKLQFRDWDNGEKSGTDVEINVKAVGFDLAYGQGTFARVRRPVVASADPMDDPAVVDVLSNREPAEAVAGALTPTSASSDASASLDPAAPSVDDPDATLAPVS